jgi:DNA-binding MarR family transcriptional regulator
MDKEKIFNFIRRYETVEYIATRKLLQRMNTQFSDTFTKEQMLTLRCLGLFGQMTVSELADRLCVKPSAVTAIMNRLTEKGYVERVRDEKDRRVVYLSLTEKGMEFYEQGNENALKMIEPYVQYFTEEEIDSLLGTYEKLSALMLHEQTEQRKKKRTE